MTPEEAAWVRANAWPPTLAAGLAPTDVCACQYGPSGWCINGVCHRCTGGTTMHPETSVTDRRGRVLYLDGKYALVWLADRICRWQCPHDCHTAAAPAYELVPLFDLAAA